MLYIGLSHSLNLGISFLTKNNLELICTEDEVASRARLVDGGCNSSINWRSGRVWRATEEQNISTQVWRIPHENIIINVLRERLEEAVGVYTQEDCSIPAGMDKYIPGQTNRGATGDVLIEI